jgi:hypothetical protein
MPGGVTFAPISLRVGLFIACGDDETQQPTEEGHEGAEATPGSGLSERASETIESMCSHGELLAKTTTRQLRPGRRPATQRTSDDD